MTARVNSAEGGTNGVNVTTANSGGASGDAWDSMYVPSGQSITFAAAAAQKGTLGYRMVYGSASGVGANVRWTLTGWPQLRARWYMRFDAYPTGMASFCYVTNAGNADAIAWLRMDASGKFIVQGDWNDVDLFRSAAAIPLNTWIRVELAMVPGTTISNGVIKFAYATADAAPTETYSNTSANLDVYGNLGRLYVGKVDGPWNATVDYDDLAADDADVATFIGASSAGPVIVDPTPAPVPPAATWPPPAPFSEAIRSGVGVTYSVSATYGGAPVAAATDLTPIGGSITDTSRPGVRRVLNLDLAGGHDLFNALAPTGTLLAVSCRVTYTDRTSVDIPMGVFDIDSERISEGEGRVSLTAPDKWARIQRARFVVPDGSTPGQLVVDTIAELIHDALGNDEEVVITATSTATVASWLVWEKDRDKAIIDLAEQIGAWVFFDRNGVATIADIPTGTTATNVWLVNAGESGVMTELTRERSRGGTYNVVVVESSAVDELRFPTQVAWDTDVESPTYAGIDPLTSPETAGPFGIVTYYLDSPILTTAGDALFAALKVLSRTKGLASQVSLGQVPNPAVDAFDVIDVLPPQEYPLQGRVLERHLVDNVSHPLTFGSAQQIDARSVGAA